MSSARILCFGLVLGLVAGCGPGGALVDEGVDAADPDSGGGFADASSQDCEPQTCEELGWACGKFVSCGETVDCADEGLSCGADDRCEGGIDGPTECVEDVGGDCDVCHAIPDCSNEDQLTRLSGRVMTPGRSDADTGNQVGVPNAIVYILRSANVSDLPPIPSGLPAGEASCDRCEDQLELRGPVLNSTVTDASGRWELEGNIPVGEEIILVVTAGKFRRAAALTLPAQNACSDVELAESVADNPTRLPRSMSDGEAVNIPRIAVTTGIIDAMECVFEKVGIDHSEFTNPEDDGRIHLYRGAVEDGGQIVQGGMRIGQQDPVATIDSDLYSDLSRLESYDMVIADCKGLDWDAEFDDQEDYGEDVIDYVNRGGRMFSSHLSATWIDGNRELGDAASFGLTVVGSADVQDGTGVIATGRERASPRIESFASWMIAESVGPPPHDAFDIRHPRSQVESLGPASEEFLFCDPSDEASDCTHETQQFAFNTPYNASAEDSCGRVAYSGFHVAPAFEGGNDPFRDRVFPDGCEGDLTDQEKTLLYMLFDLAACIGDPVPPPTPCNPRSCPLEECGFVPDGCGELLDCECPID